MNIAKFKIKKEESAILKHFQVKGDFLISQVQLDGDQIKQYTPIRPEELFEGRYSKCL